jgi:hypothetical protein
VQLTRAGLETESRVFADIAERTQHLLDRVPPDREDEVGRAVALLLTLLEAETGRHEDRG